MTQAGAASLNGWLLRMSSYQLFVLLRTVCVFRSPNTQTHTLGVVFRCFRFLRSLGDYLIWISFCRILDKATTIADDENKLIRKLAKEKEKIINNIQDLNRRYQACAHAVQDYKKQLQELGSISSSNVLTSSTSSQMPLSLDPSMTAPFSSRVFPDSALPLMNTLSNPLAQTLPLATHSSHLQALYETPNMMDPTQYRWIVSIWSFLFVCCLYITGRF